MVVPRGRFVRKLRRAVQHLRIARNRLDAESGQCDGKQLVHLAVKHPRSIADTILVVAFAVATCPKCEKRFRLVWRTGKRKLEPSQVIRLACPFCGIQFEQVAVKLVVFDAGAEQFPESVVVEPCCLASGK